MYINYDNIYLLDHKNMPNTEIALEPLLSGEVYI